MTDSPVVMVARFAQQRVAERLAEDLPTRAAKMNAVIRRFQDRIAAVGGDPEAMLNSQQEDLMREGLYTSPIFLRGKVG